MLEVAGLSTIKVKMHMNSDNVLVIQRHLGQVQIFWRRKAKELEVAKNDSSFFIGCPLHIHEQITMVGLFFQFSLNHSLPVENWHLKNSSRSSQVENQPMTELHFLNQKIPIFCFFWRSVLLFVWISSCKAWEICSSDYIVVVVSSSRSPLFTSS